MASSLLTQLTEAKKPTPPAPPFDPAPKAPLTSAQKHAIGKYLEAYSKYQTGSVGPQDTETYWVKQPDAIILNIYGLALQSHQTGNDQKTLPGGEDPGIPTGTIPGVQSVADLIGSVLNPHTWIRVAEFTIGAILIAVAVAAVLKKDVAPNASIAKEIPGI